MTARARTLLPPATLGLLILLRAGVGDPVPAHGAVRVPLEWTAPAGVERYEAIARRGDGVFLAPSLYAESTGTAPPLCEPAGAPQRAWVLVSEDWRAGGWMIWVRGCNSGGCAPWSNAVVVVAGIPDTNWMLERGVGGGVRPPREGSVWRRARGRVSWALRYGDSIATARIVHQESVQSAVSRRLCELFGFWLLRGRVVACP